MTAAVREARIAQGRRELANFDPYTNPGWLVKLIESDDLYQIESTARLCGDRYNIRVLSQRADELIEQREATS